MHIRAFESEDRAELEALAAYAGRGSPTASLWGHAPSEAAIYLAPYIDLDAGTVLLAQDEGALVGYLVGCLDTAAFPSEDERMAEAIRTHRLFLKPGPAVFFARAMADSALAALARRPLAGGFDDPRWPSHLHINVAAPARGTGAAEGLMRAWQQRVAEAGSPGCHLQTLAENTRAVRFFTRMGFTAHGPAPLVPGLRHEGRRLHQRTMVWSP
ncbi:GCN5 family acetyltransferase [Streptomonospora alba]|uniref:GCN5 family acetyltransferase n=2 Tax=Streptomonospora alba TaxID=183763 RepID=A0A0C2JR02_9ACTN|nr:GCN5 family acetyltransferase [Streptomonospora alba]